MTYHELYEFQEEDVKKHSAKKHGLIGNEMGTGKTHEAIAIDQNWWDGTPAATRKATYGTLIVAPLNTFDSWQEKYALQAPHLDVVTIDRKNRAAFVKAVQQKKGDVFLMHWDALRLMPELQKLQFHCIIADEVHRAANREAQSTRALKKLHTNHKLAMSGTASGDKPQNLWSILNWLWPTYYSGYWKFRKHYCVEEEVWGKDAQGNIEKKGYTQIVGVKNIASLMAEMAPWYTRHLKRERCCEHHPEGVMGYLPEKTYDTIWVDLNATQRKFYDQMRREMVSWVNENEQTPLVAQIVVVQLVRLSQMALATPEVYQKWVWKLNEATGEKVKVLVDAVRLIAPSTKIDAVKELIHDHEGKQFVVFSSSKQACYLAQEAFAKAKPPITSEVLSGDTPQSQREGMVGRFVAKEYQVFIGVIQAAAEGIDGLQHATDTAIFLDRSWSTIKNKQAEDRLHRDGQKDTVQIIDVMARSTLDFGRKTRLETKWEWIRTILGDPAKAQKEILEEK